MSSSAQETLFSLLPPTRTPWLEFVFSTGTQALMVAALISMRLMVPVVSPADHFYHPIVLVSTPAPVNHQPQPVVHIRTPVVAELDPPANALRLPAPQPKPVMKMEDVPVPTAVIAPKKIDSVPAAAPVIPKGVKVEVFSTGSSATPAIVRASSREQVQTGGFGDPNGIPAKMGQGKPVNIASTGSFDLPSGPGYGNGTGGAKGVSGIVASSGFGNGTAIAETRPRPHQTIQSSGFFSADVPAPVSMHSHAVETVTPLVPAEILSKPTPVYTQEARGLRIEGEVLLEVVLGASGSLHVLRVVRGLGHGLDDNAVKAAEQIRFRPALRGGRPADSTVVLHVIFQLA